MSNYSKNAPVFMKIETLKNLIWEVGFYDGDGDWHRKDSKTTAEEAQRMADNLNIKNGFPTLQQATDSDQVTTFKTVEEVKDWFIELCKEFGHGWHPEDGFSDFNGVAPERGAVLDTLLDDAWSVCQAAHIDTNEVALAAFKATDPETYARIIGGE